VPPLPAGRADRAPVAPHLNDGIRPSTIGSRCRWPTGRNAGSDKGLEGASRDRRGTYQADPVGADPLPSLPTEGRRHPGDVMLVTPEPPVAFVEPEGARLRVVLPLDHAMPYREVPVLTARPPQPSWRIREQQRAQLWRPQHEVHEDYHGGHLVPGGRARA
jgi:hypothetical protein